MPSKGAENVGEGDAGGLGGAFAASYSVEQNKGHACGDQME